jgi:hypothetical protein
MNWFWGYSQQEKAPGGAFVETYRRGDELRDHLIHLGVTLDRIAVLHAQGVEKGVRAVAKVLPGVVAAHGVLVVREALDVEELPRGKRVVEHPSSDLPPHLDLDVPGWVTSERECEYGAALGEVDVVGRSTVGRAVVVCLPGGWGQAFADDGVILEDKKEAALPDGICFKGSVYIGLSLVNHWV